MPRADLEARVSALEAELAQVKTILEKPLEAEGPWWKRIAGKYANDPIYEEAMRLGREWRESTRPKSRSRKKV